MKEFIAEFNQEFPSLTIIFSGLVLSNYLILITIKIYLNSVIKVINYQLKSLSYFPYSQGEIQKCVESEEDLHILNF